MTQVRALSPARAFSLFAAAVAAAFIAAVVWHCLQHGYFWGDDFTTFLHARTRPLARLLVTPLGSQIVPLHRAVTVATMYLAPMNYGVALGVLLAFHAIAVVYLYRTLELIAPRDINWAFVALYGVYAFLGANLVWFTSGMTRFPYIAFATMAAYHYLHYTKTGRRRDLVWVVVAYLLSLGFYSKGILIPLLCIGLDISVHGPRAAAALPQGGSRNKWLVFAGLCIASVVFVLLVSSLLSESERQTNTDWQFQLLFQLFGWSVFAYSLVDRGFEYGNVPSVWVLLPWVLFAAYSIYRCRKLVWTWLVVALWIAANVLIIGMSNRTLLFGLFMPFEYRHYYEFCFALVLLLAIVHRRLSQEAPEIRWLSRGAAGTATVAVLSALFAVHGLFAYRAYEHYFERKYGEMRQTRPYMHRLRADLESLGVEHDPTATFVDGYVPVYVAAMDMSFKHHSQLFAAMGVDARFRRPRAAKYRIEDDGHIAAARGNARK